MSQDHDAFSSEYPVLLPNAMAMSGTELPLRARSGFLALLLPDSLLMSDVSVTIKGYADA